MSFKYPLATSTWDEEEVEQMNRVIASGRFTMGAEVETFERDFAAFMGSKFALMVNSGSSANLLMIAALFFSKDPNLMLNRGDEVIVPAVSWATTYAPLQQYGLKVKFVDVDVETLNFDMEQLSDAITDNTRLIFAVNLWVIRMISHHFCSLLLEKVSSYWKTIVRLSELHMALHLQVLLVLWGPLVRFLAIISPPWKVA